MGESMKGQGFFSVIILLGGIVLMIVLLNPKTINVTGNVILLGAEPPPPQCQTSFSGNRILNPSFECTTTTNRNNHNPLGCIIPTNWYLQNSLTATNNDTQDWNRTYSITSCTIGVGLNTTPVIYGNYSLTYNNVTTNQKVTQLTGAFNISQDLSLTFYINFTIFSGVNNRLNAYFIEYDSGDNILLKIGQDDSGNFILDETGSTVFTALSYPTIAWNHQSNFWKVQANFSTLAPISSSGVIFESDNIGFVGHPYEIYIDNVTLTLI